MGLTLLVTRARDDASRTAAALAERGHRALIAPVIAIEANGARPPSGAFDGLILTSAHAAGALARMHQNSVPLFAVGPRTAQAARTAGATLVYEGSGAAAELVALIQRVLPPPGRLLHLAGRHRKVEPERSLAASGYDVHVFEAYEAVAAAALPAHSRAALAAGEIDGALHYSRRSAAILMQLAAQADLLPELALFGHACLSDDAAAPLRALSGARIVVVARPEENLLLDAIETLPRRAAGTFAEGSS